MNKIPSPYVYWLFVLIAFSACGDDDPSGAPEDPTTFIAGRTTGTNVFFSNLASPDETAVDQTHTTTREVDINNDQIIDFEIISSELNTVNVVIKLLSITTEGQNSVAVNKNPAANPKIFQQGDTIRIADEDWVNQVQEYTLAGQEVSSAGTTELGNWNGQRNRYLAVWVRKDGENILGWIELSVDNFDNYTFHNYASKPVVGG